MRSPGIVRLNLCPRYAKEDFSFWLVCFDTPQKSNTVVSRCNNLKNHTEIFKNPSHYCQGSPITLHFAQSGSPGTPNWRWGSLSFRLVFRRTGLKKKKPMETVTSMKTINMACWYRDTNKYLYTRLLNICILAGTSRVL